VIAAAAIAAGVQVFPVPGANAAISALVASGLAGGVGQAGSAGDGGAERFTFHGFLPAKEGQRRTALERLLGSEGGPQVFYEAPHRILATLEDVEAVFGAAQHVVVARELTKMHEEFLRGPVGEVRAALEGRASVRGEMVLLFAPAAVSASGESAATSIAEEVRALTKQGLTEKEALKQVARARGLGKSEAYRELQRERGR
jgi:16S rRNA (cytidine1402-2'-O)-methyltransferase